MEALTFYNICFFAGKVPASAGIFFFFARTAIGIEALLELARVCEGSDGRKPDPKGIAQT